jgi:hypothetical protein
MTEPNDLDGGVADFPIDSYGEDQQDAALFRPLRENRSPWTPKAALLDRLLNGQADPGLTTDLDQLSGDTGRLGPVA